MAGDGSPASLSAGVARAHHSLAADGDLPFRVEQLPPDDAEGITFVRARLEKETAQTFFDIFRCVRDPTCGTAFVARARPLGEADPTTPTGILIGALVLDTSRLRSHRLVGISWVSVLFAYRGAHVGRSLVRRAEDFARAADALSVHVPMLPFQTTLFARLGYAVRTRRPTVLYRQTHVLSKALAEECGSGDDASSAEAALRPDRRRTPRRPSSPAPGRGGGSEGEGSVTGSVSEASASEQESGRLARRKRCRPPAVSSAMADAGVGVNARRAAKRAKPAEPAGKDAANKAAATAATPVADEGTRAASRAFSSAHSAHEGGMSAKEITHRNTAAQWFAYSIPDCPSAVRAGDVFFRMAVPEDRRQWSALMLAACHYNMGGSCMMRVTLEAACRIVAVRAADRTSIVGLVAMQESGWVSFIACDIEYRSQGLGSFLLFLAMEWARVRQVRTVSLTPLNRKGMEFYHKWGFHAFAAEPRQKKASLAAADLIMVRKIDPEVYLLPNGRPLKAFIENYDASGEVAETSKWYYYFYSPRARKPRARETTESAGEEAAEDTRAGARRTGRRVRPPAGRTARAAPAREPDAVPPAASDEPTEAPSTDQQLPPLESTLDDFMSCLKGTATPAPSQGVSPSQLYTVVEDTDNVEEMEGVEEVEEHHGSLDPGGGRASMEGTRGPSRPPTDRSLLRALLDSWRERVRLRT